jgi:hypothetical protein
MMEVVNFKRIVVAARVCLVGRLAAKQHSFFFYVCMVVGHRGREKRPASLQSRRLFFCASGAFLTRVFLSPRRLRRRHHRRRSRFRRDLMHRLSTDKAARGLLQIAPRKCAEDTALFYFSIVLPPFAISKGDFGGEKKKRTENLFAQSLGIILNFWRNYSAIRLPQLKSWPLCYVAMRKISPEIEEESL